KKAEDLGKKTDGELARLLCDDPNPYKQRTALRLLSERKNVGKEIVADLLKSAENEDGVKALHAVWGLLAVDRFGTKGDRRNINRTDDRVRAWLVRFLAEAETEKKPDRISPAQGLWFGLLVQPETSSAVRLELASAALRLGDDDGTPFLTRGLLTHKED